MPGGCRPPLRCSGTTGELICTLSQPSLSRNLAEKETAAGGPRRTEGKREGGGWVGGQDNGFVHIPSGAALILIYLIDYKHDGFLFNSITTGNELRQVIKVFCQNTASVQKINK